MIFVRIKKVEDEYSEVKQAPIYIGKQKLIHTLRFCQPNCIKCNYSNQIESY